MFRAMDTFYMKTLHTLMREYFFFEHYGRFYITVKKRRIEPLGKDRALFYLKLL